MAANFNRDEREALLAAAIMREFTRFRRYLTREIPNLDGASSTVPQDEMNAHTAAMVAAIQPQLRGTYMVAADVTLDEFSYLGVGDYAELSDEAARWATAYTLALVGGLNNTSERALSRTIADYFDNDLTRAALIAALIGSFGPRRAEMIAITETTAGITGGQDGASAALGAANGVLFRTTWETEEDERVCQICRPLHGLEIEPNNETSGRRPPAHPRCRCEEVKELIDVE